MLPMWVLALPIWLVVFIVLYALATLYVAIKYRDVRKFLAGAFFFSPTFSTGAADERFLSILR